MLWWATRLHRSFFHGPLGRKLAVPLRRLSALTARVRRLFFLAPPAAVSVPPPTPPPPRAAGIGATAAREPFHQAGRRAWPRGGGRAAARRDFNSNSEAGWQLPGGQTGHWIVVCQYDSNGDD